MKTHMEVLEKVIRVIPYSNSIRSIDITSEEDAVRFNWRSKNFRVSLRTECVEEAYDDILSHSDASILLEGLLKRGVQ